jgi:hypothetical protein
MNRREMERRAQGTIPPPRGLDPGLWERLMRRAQMELDRTDTGNRAELGPTPWQRSNVQSPSRPSLISLRQAKVQAAIQILAPTGTTSLSLESTDTTRSPILQRIRSRLAALQSSSEQPSPQNTNPATEQAQQPPEK